MIYSDYNFDEYRDYDCDDNYEDSGGFHKLSERGLFNNENDAEHHQWFLDECFELYLLLKDWTERNGLALCENLTVEQLEDFLSNDFTFTNDKMNFESSRFQKWRQCYEKWIDDICYYEIRWTLFNACPVENFCWFVFKTSSGYISEFA